MKKQTVQDYPEMLAKIEIKNPVNGTQLSSYQCKLTALSRDVDLSHIELVFSGAFNNRGIRGGKCRLVDLLKTLGAGVDALDCTLSCSPEAELTDTSNPIDGYINSLYAKTLKKEPINKASKLVLEFLQMDGIKGASISIDTHKNSPLANGFYLLYPFLELVYAAINAYALKAVDTKREVDAKECLVGDSALQNLLYDEQKKAMQT